MHKYICINIVINQYKFTFLKNILGRKKYQGLVKSNLTSLGGDGCTAIGRLPEGGGIPGTNLALTTLA